MCKFFLSRASFVTRALKISEKIQNKKRKFFFTFVTCMTSVFLLCFCPVLYFLHLFHKPIYACTKRDMPAVGCFTAELFASSLSHCTRTRKGFCCCCCGSAKPILICLPLSSIKSPGVRSTDMRGMRWINLGNKQSKQHRLFRPLGTAGGHCLVCIFRRLLQSVKTTPSLYFSAPSATPLSEWETESVRVVRDEVNRGVVGAMSSACRLQFHHTSPSIAANAPSGLFIRQLGPCVRP